MCNSIFRSAHASGVRATSDGESPTVLRLTCAAWHPPALLRQDERDMAIRLAAGVSDGVA